MEQEDAFHVQLESGEVRLLSLDQLDRFYQNSIIDEETYILRDGEMEWRKLGEVLGGDEEEPAAEQPTAAATTQTPAPMAFTPAPSFSPSFTPSFEPYQPMSIRPVVSEIDGDELSFDENAFKKSGKAKWVAIGAVGVALAAMGAFVGASHMGHSVDSAAVQAAMVEAAQTTPAVVTPPPPPPADPQPVAQAPKLNDDAKKALADKDAQFNQKQQARKQSRLQTSLVSHHKSSAPFSKSGNAYDPLNAKL